jgi:hypothetical protein
MASKISEFLEQLPCAQSASLMMMLMADAERLRGEQLAEWWPATRQLTYSTSPPPPPPHKTYFSKHRAQYRSGCCRSRCSCCRRPRGSRVAPLQPRRCARRSRSTAPLSNPRQRFASPAFFPASAHDRYLVLCHARFAASLVRAASDTLSATSTSSSAQPGRQVARLKAGICVHPAPLTLCRR